MKQAFLPLGEIVAAHGVRGEVRVNPNTDEPELLCKKGTFYYDNRGQNPLTILRGAPHKHIILVKIEGIDTPEEACALRGRTIYAPREAFHLKKGQHFIADLLGMKVVDDRTGEVYGKLRQVIDYPAQNLYEIQKENGSLVYLPAVPQFLGHVDDEAEEIRITPPEGLFHA